MRKCAHILLLLCAALIMMAADPPNHPQLLVVHIDDAQCRTALTSFADAHPDRLQFARPDWKKAYTLVAFDDADIDPAAQYQNAHQQWRHGAFRKVLSGTTANRSLLKEHASYRLDGPIVSLALLRISTLLVLDRQTRANQESILLLSRHRARAYCSDTAFPEACARLTNLEARASIQWKEPRSDLLQLSHFAKTSGQTLTLLTTAPTDGIRWDRITDAASDTHTTTRGDCQHVAFWRDSFEAWSAHLQNPREASIIAGTAPAPIQRVTRLVLPTVGAALLALSVLTTVQMHHRKAHFDDCLQSSRACSNHAALDDAQSRWIHARRQTAGLWAAVGAVGLASIPLGMAAREAGRARRKTSVNASP